MREKVWYEMVHSKFGEFYLAHYLTNLKDKRRWFKIFLLIFSTSGVFGWGIWDYAPVIACVLISIAQLIALVENHIVPSDKDIEDISELRIRYIDYFNKLEKLWIELESNQVNEQEVKDQFYGLRITGSEIEAVNNVLHISGNRSIIKKKSEEAALNYFKQYHQ